MRRFILAMGIMALVPMLGLMNARAEDKKDKKPAPKPTIAVFRLGGGITEEPEDELFPFGGPPPVSLKDLVARMKKAKDDANVKALVILSEGGSVGSAQTEELRQAMGQFRSAGKDIFVHSDSLAMRDYVLMSGASRISAVPTADLWVTGLYGEAPYVRGLLNKIGVKPDYLTCGDYKSAAEIFMREGPSPEADRMQNWLLDSLYDSFVQLIAKGRAVDAAKVKAWIDGGPYSAAKAKEIGMIDAVEHRQEFEAMLKEKFGKEMAFDRKYGQKKQPTLEFSNPFAIFKIFSDLIDESKKKKSGKDAVGIVYVEGPILVGGDRSSPFSSGAAMSSKIRKALDDAAKDNSIKAVVLRVNSPGGSAVASEIILDATKRVKAKKPFVVSMGDVAGSGGYYVACGADVIFADEATITGSIGVVAGKFATTDMWKKLGITFKAYQRGANAGMLSSADVFTKEERQKLQAWMDEIYGVFKGHVMAIRGSKLKKPIDELAGGRVYTGKQALDLGLIDKIGTLQDAVAFAADKADLKDYDIRVVPEPKNFLEQLIEEASGGKDDPSRVGLTARIPRIRHTPSLVDLALPYLKHMDPDRVGVIKLALERMQLLQQEGVVFMMPEMLLSR